MNDHQMTADDSGHTTLKMPASYAVDVAMPI